MCRHCIAVLLEYHRWVQPRSKKVKPPAPVAPQSSGGGASPLSGASADFKLSEVLAFIEWLQPAMKALEKAEPLPDSSRLTGDLATWTQLISNLDNRRRESEEAQLALEAEQRDREAYVHRMTQQLQASMAELLAGPVAGAQVEPGLA